MEIKHCKKCKIALPDDRKDKLCENCRGKRASLIKRVLVGVGIFGAAVVTVLASTSSNDEDDCELDYDFTDDNDTTTSDVPHSPYNPRYNVEMKAFKTGEWYTKTRTDNIGSAYSVAQCNNWGRAYRVVDTVTDTILTESEEDAGMKESNGYPNGYPW